jgi:hypothetical protein
MKPIARDYYHKDKPDGSPQTAQQLWRDAHTEDALAEQIREALRKKNGEAPLAVRTSPGPLTLQEGRGLMTLVVALALLNLIVWSALAIIGSDLMQARGERLQREQIHRLASADLCSTDTDCMLTYGGDGGPAPHDTEF